MANQPESAVYDAGVYQIEIIDPVQGGVGGKSNAPLVNLANRTAYLKQHVDDMEAGITVPPGTAILNSPTFTGDPKAPTPAGGDNDTSIATTEFVQRTVNGRLSKSVAGGVNVALTAAECDNGILEFTGVLTANIAVIIPNTTGRWDVANKTTGAYTLTVKTAAGTGIAVTQALRAPLACDATNVYDVLNDFQDVALSGVPTAPTAVLGTNTTQVANMAAVQAAIAALVASSPAALDTLNELAVALGNDPNFATTITNALSLKAPLASPALTGAPTAPTAAAGTNTTQLATTGFVDAVRAVLVAADALKAPLASPTFSGIPAAPTAAPGTNTTQLANTAFVEAARAILVAAVALKAPLASPALTGVPTAPTAVLGTNTTQIATMAAIQSAIAALVASSPATLDTLNELAAALGGDPNFATTIATSIGLKAPLVSPALTGTPTVPTAAPGTDNTQAASTAFVMANAGGVAASETVAGKAEIATFTEVDGATDNTKIVTPIKLAGGTTRNLMANGYIKLPSWMGGLILQWGAASLASGGSTVTFPLAFPNNVFCTLASSDATGNPWVTYNSTTLGSVFLKAWNTAGTIAATVRFFTIGN